MKVHSSINKTVRELIENIQSATWTNLEPREPPTSVHRSLESMDSGCIPVHGPIVIREKEPVNDSP